MLEKDRLIKIRKILKIKQARNLSFHRGTVSIKFDEKGYVISTKNFNFILWTSFHQPYELEEFLRGKHLKEISELLHQYGINSLVAKEFDEIVVKRVLKQ